MGDARGEGKPVDRGYEVWEVVSATTKQVLCSATMGLTEAQARNKVENDRRTGYQSEARRAQLSERTPHD